jgi:hypothetical protein
MAGESQMVPDSAADPSVLTTQQLERGLSSAAANAEAKRAVLHEQISAVERVLVERVKAVEQVYAQRIDDIDRATEVLNEQVNRVPTDVQQAVGHLKELVDEKFASVAKQFLERDTRSERESRDNKVAVDAAFAAQKEAASEQNKSNTLAIDKSEKATAETLAKQADLFKSTTDAQLGQITDLKERLSRIESALTGRSQQKDDARKDSTLTLAVVGLIATLVLVVIAVAGFIVANA